LETIPGIGEKTIVELFKHFKSTKRIAGAGFDELAEVVGADKAKKIITYFQVN
jgi:excinuclease ABC subunit C